MYFALIHLSCIKECVVVSNLSLPHNPLANAVNFVLRFDRPREWMMKRARRQRRGGKKKNGMLKHRSYFSPSTSTSRFRISRVPPSTRNIRACHRDEVNVSPVHSIYFTCLFQPRLITFAATSCGRVSTYECMHVWVFRVYVEIRCTCSCHDLHNTPVFTDSSTYTSPSPLSSLTRCKSAQWKRCRLNRLSSSRFVSHVISSRCHALTSINVECQNPFAYFAYYARLRFSIRYTHLGLFYSFLKYILHFFKHVI